MSSPSGAALLTYWAIARQIAARPMEEAITSIRRPPRLRSSIGPSTGATMANGAMVRRRYSSTFPRAAPLGFWKNSEPASDTVRQASPATLMAWA